MSYECSECGSNHLSFIRHNVFHCDNCNADLQSELSRSAEIWKFTLQREIRNKKIKSQK
jgi:ribosomal protein L37AE/L43A